MDRIPHAQEAAIAAGTVLIHPAPVIAEREKNGNVFNFL